MDDRSTDVLVQLWNQIDPGQAPVVELLQRGHGARRRRRRALRVTAAAASLCVIGVVSLGVTLSQGDSPSGPAAGPSQGPGTNQDIADCLAEERSAYPALKAQAEQIMPPSALMQFPDRGGFNCEDSVVPRPGALAIMKDWRPRDAVSYLRANGWHPNGGGGFTSPDRTLVASPSGVSVDGKDYVAVLFVPHTR